VPKLDTGADVSRLHIVFDLDDTLYPERDYALSGFRAAARWAGETLGLSAGEVARMAERMTALLEEGHRGNLFGIALAEVRPDCTPEDVAGVHEAYRAHTPERLDLFADAVWALERYRLADRAHGALGLITDGHLVMQSSKVAALGIASHFHEIVYTGGLGPGRTYFKPHPMAFERMVAAVGAQGDRFVYVGDNPSKDFVAPNAMGWLSVWVDRPGGIHHGAPVAEGGTPQVTIRSLRELPEILGR
jgi:putative hydrolase of the HAD superfamily